MDPARVGRSLRALRRRLGWRQADLAVRARVSQQTISDIERGRAAGVSWPRLERVGAALGASLDVVVRWRGAELDRLLDERHAEACAAVAARLQRLGYQTLIEATYSIYGERGSVDVVGWRPADRSLVIVEVKVDLASAEATTRKHDEKIRLARSIGRERFGVAPRVVIGLLAIVDSTASRDRVRRHARLFDAAYPARGHEVRALVRRGSGGRGLVFLPLTPAAGTTRVSAARKRGTPSPPR